MVKVSVIIPVYNAEKYLHECIVSLLNQSLKEMEFIFVNDGSQDASPQIIASFQATDSRITLINQTNLGVSVARNNGIAIAQGDYIGFVDADDYVKTDLYEVLFNHAIATESDVVVTSYYKEFSGVFTDVNLPFMTDTTYDIAAIRAKIIPYLIEQDGLNTSCTKLYRKSLLAINSVSFPEGIAIGEDGLFNFKLFNVANRVHFTSYKGYFYREVSGSATRNLASKDYFKRALEVYHTDYHSLSKRPFSEEEMQILQGRRLIKQALSILVIYQNPNNSLPFLQRYTYCRAIAKNKTIKFLVSTYWEAMNENKNKFQKIILLFIRYNLFLPLWFSLHYTNYKNRLNENITFFPRRKYK
jgi:glycosyltransferase involved in cell wall biosynthesis